MVVVCSLVFAGSQQTSSTLASTIITNARYYLGEATADYWSDAELLVYLNKGTLDIVSRTRALESSASIDLVSDTTEYTVTPDYIDITTVIYNNASGDPIGLIHKNPQSVGRLSPGVPTYWYEWAGKVGIFPALSARTTETVSVYYVSRPSAVTAASAVVVPAIYDQALTLYIASQGLLKERQFAKAGQLMAAYYAELDRYRQDFVDQQKEPETNVTK